MTSLERAMSEDAEDLDVLEERRAIAAAAERRLRTTIPDHERLAFDAEHDLRQSFRRLVNPGIIRPNSRETASTALETLLTIASNILNNPDQDKFRKFKPTNSIIKKTLVDVPGALEYAIAMGFRATVENFQPFYVFSNSHMQELRVGAAILKDALELEASKVQRLGESRSREKQGAEDAIRKVKLNFEEDRKEKRLRDAIAKQQHERAISEAVVDQVAAVGLSKDLTAHKVGPSDGEYRKEE